MFGYVVEIAILVKYRRPGFNCGGCYEAIYDASYPDAFSLEILIDFCSEHDR